MGGLFGRAALRRLLCGPRAPRRPCSGEPSWARERTLVAVKPDGVQRRLVGEVIQRFERRGFRLVGMKMLQVPESVLAEHYQDLQGKPFYPALIRYMSSGPVVAMVWEGHNVVRASRVMIGNTDSGEAAPGTIRGDFSVHISRDQVAFITGGGSGIGFRIAEVFMRHGCHTVIASRSLPRVLTAAKKLAAATGRRCLPLSVDVRDAPGVMAAVDQALQEFGKVDILVNCAAGNFLCPAGALSFNAFKTVIDIDTIGTFNVSRVLYEKVFQMP